MSGAGDDYIGLLRAVYDLADYVTINLSSPNTPGLRRLQAGRLLERLLSEVCQARSEMELSSGRHLPLAIKLSPDLAPSDLEAAVEAAQAHGLEGIVAVNTSRARDGVTSPGAREEGGLSGRPLWPAALGAVACLRACAGDAMTVIGVGGIDSPERASHTLDSGADLIQVYTGLVYEGPGLPASILRALAGRTAGAERGAQPIARVQRPG